MRHPPIDSHGFLSDTHTTALVGPDGGVDWLCVPQADGPSLFARILDRDRGGSWHLGIEDGHVTGQSYLNGTFVLVTTWQGPTGTAEVVDLLAVESSEDPDDFDAAHVLLRVVRAVRGRVRVTCDVDARPDYARCSPSWQRDGTTWTEEASGVRLSDGGALVAEGDRLVGVVELGVGEEMALALEYLDVGRGRDPISRAGELIESTTRTWRGWTELTHYEGPAPEAVERSALLLRALSFDDTGALLAAPTTSLPEEIGGERNYDYRFTWHRDASLHVMSLYLLGHERLGGRYGRFLVDHCVSGGGDLRPMAGLNGQQMAAEERLDHLSGYRGSRPVRVGNEAFEQVQHSTDGFVLDASLVYHRLVGRFRPGDWEALRSVVDRAAGQWREPDANIWEMRGPAGHYTHSKLLNWVCLDRGLKLARAIEDSDAPVQEWQDACEALREDILIHGWDAEQGAFTQEYGKPALDASMLRLGLLGFLPGDDERVLSTIDRIADELGDGPALIRRYDTDEVDDGMGGSEGAFLLSSFEMVSALVLGGRVGEARQRFDWLVERAGPLGLYAEQMGPDGTALGNYPQAFTHLGLIEAAVILGWADDPVQLAEWAQRSPKAFTSPE